MQQVKFVNVCYIRVSFIHKQILFHSISFFLSSATNVCVPFWLVQHLYRRYGNELCESWAVTDRFQAASIQYMSWERTFYFSNNWTRSGISFIFPKRSHSLKGVARRKYFCCGKWHSSNEFRAKKSRFSFIKVIVTHGDNTTSNILIPLTSQFELWLRLVYTWQRP